MYNCDFFKVASCITFRNIPRHGDKIGPQIEHETFLELEGVNKRFYGKSASCIDALFAAAAQAFGPSIAAIAAENPMPSNLPNYSAEMNAVFDMFRDAMSEKRIKYPVQRMKQAL